MKYLKSKGLILIGTIFLLSIFSLTQFDFITYDSIENKSAKFKIPRLGNSDITISTPENKTYTEPMSGYYPATYGFENDEEGSIPKEWEEDSTSGSDYYTFIDAIKAGHKNVLGGYDGEDYGAFRINHYFNATEGTIEFWMLHTSLDYDHAITTVRI